MTATAIRTEIATALAEAGAPVTLIRETGGPATPWDTTAFAEAQETPLRAGPPSPYRRGLVDGTLIRADDLRVMVEAGPVDPTTADRLRIGGVDHAIVAVRPTFFQDGAVAWELQCRK